MRPVIGYQYLLAARQRYPRVWHVVPDRAEGPHALCGKWGRPETKRRKLPYPSAPVCGHCRPKLTPVGRLGHRCVGCPTLLTGHQKKCVPCCMRTLVAALRQFRRAA